MEEFSPASFTLLQLVQPACFALAGAVIIALIAAMHAYWSAPAGSKPPFKQTFSRAFILYFGVGIPIALIGYASGYLTGLSRSPAIGNLLPAVLALIGGVSVYAFGADASYRFVVGYCATLLVVTLFYGTESGSFEREVHREARLKSVFELERRLRTYRTNRDLPEKSADWLYLGESK